MQVEEQNENVVSYKTLRLLSKCAKVLKPKPPLTISEWADRYMVLPEGSNESGHFSSDTIPYQKEIMNAITDPEVTSVSVMSSSQVGKTTIIMCGVGYYIDYEPATQMIVMPTEKDGERFSKTRFAEMIREIPNLREKVADVKSRDSNNTILLKSYPGGNIAIAGANSPRTLASDPRRIIWMDEIDRFPDSAGSEGNPIKLAEKRATSFWNKKFIRTSTPTIRGRSKIATAYEKGSQEVWSVRCPACGEFQPYEFKRISFDDVGMACKYCGVVSSENQWKESEHKWIATHPERKRDRSFRLNELASPFVDWIDIINDFKDADEQLKKYNDPQDLKVFVNTVLGETWDDSIDDSTENDDEALASRAEQYGAEIPEGVILLTGAVDVQDDRLEVEIRGWGKEFETWGLYKTEIYGNLDLATTKPWKELEEYLTKTFHFKDGRSLNVAAFSIDTGGNHTNTVYLWTKEIRKKYKNIFCYPIKGYNGHPECPLVYKTSVGNITEIRNGKKVVTDHSILYIVGVDSGKDDISNRLAIEEPGPGYCHFPKDEGRGYDERYYKGLFSEHRVLQKSGGVYRKMWKKKPGVLRNEPFDLLNYNYYTLCKLNPDLDKLEKKINSGVNYMRSSGRKRQASRKPMKAIDI